MSRLGGKATTPIVCPSPFSPLAFAAGAATLLVAWSLVRLSNRGAGRRVLALAVAGIVAFASLTAFFVAENELDIAAQEAWTFDYEVGLVGNGSATITVIVPVPVDGALVASLSLTSGSANWSLVNTIHGPGLYIRYTGNTTLWERTQIYQRARSVPDTNLTMTTINASVAPPAILGSAWAFASLGVRISVYALVVWQGGWGIDVAAESGWSRYPARYAPLLPGTVLC